MKIVVCSKIYTSRWQAFVLPDMHVPCTCRIFCYKGVSIASVHINDYLILRSVTSMLAICHVGEQMF